MSKIVQWKRGNANVSSTYIGAQGEITVNTTDYTLNVHDGTTPGGFKILNTNSAISIGNIAFTDQTMRGTVSNRDVTISPLNANVVISSNVLNFSNSAALTYTSSANYVELSTNTGLDSDLRLTASDGSYAATIYLWANNRKMGFNTVTNAYDFNFNGIVSGTDYVANPNSQIGYSFYRPTPNLYSGFSHVNSSNAEPLSYLRITHDGVDAIRIYEDNTTKIIGNLVVTPDVSVTGFFPGAFVQILSNIPSYSQLIHQNLSTDPSSSTDFVATADNGDDATYYVDLGITSEAHVDADFFGDTSSFNDAYLYAVGYDQAGPSFGNIGNLILGSTNGVVKTFVGNTAEANVVTITNRTGFIPGANAAYSLGTSSRQWNNLWVSNNTVNFGGFPVQFNSNGALYINGITVGAADTGNVAFTGTELSIKAGSPEANISLNANDSIKFLSKTYFPPTLTVDGGESSFIIGTRKTVGGEGTQHLYAVTLPGEGITTLVYTASDFYVRSCKITFAVQSAGAFSNWEQFDVVAVKKSDGVSADVVVSNRIRRDDSIGYTAVTASVNLSDEIEIYFTQPAGQTIGWVTYDAVEFNLMDTASS